MKKIRLTESEFHSLIRKMVLEAQKEMSEMDHSEEMEEGMLGDLGRGVKKFATGYGSDEEMEERKKSFFTELDDIEQDFEENPENYFFSDWDKKREQLERSAEANNYLGHIEQLGKKDRYVRYVKGKKGFEKMATGYNKAQGSTIYERQRRK
jgi:hypothetical protein